MYIQDRFREERVETLHAFMRAHALGTVVVGVPRAAHDAARDIEAIDVPRDA